MGCLLYGEHLASLTYWSSRCACLDSKGKSPREALGQRFQDSAEWDSGALKGKPGNSAKHHSSSGDQLSFSSSKLEHL